MIKGNKGSIQDVFLIVCLLFLTAVVFLFVFLIQKNLDTAMSPAFESVAAGSSIGMTTVTSIFTNSMNYIYLAAFFALLISTCVMAFMTPTHPVFYGLAVIMFIGLMVVSVVISNAWAAISTANANITDITNILTIPDYLMLNLPLIMIVIGVLIAIILFSKSGSGETIPMQ